MYVASCLLQAIPALQPGTHIYGKGHQIPLSGLARYKCFRCQQIPVGKGAYVLRVCPHDALETVSFSEEHGLPWGPHNPKNLLTRGLPSKAPLLITPSGLIGLYWCLLCSPVSEAVANVCTPQFSFLLLYCTGVLFWQRNVNQPLTKANSEVKKKKQDENQQEFPFQWPNGWIRKGGNYHHGSLAPYNILVFHWQG